MNKKIETKSIFLYLYLRLLAEGEKMKALRTLLLASVAAVSASPSAQAYPIDCAIILCLAGGFPASAECTAAKATMIRRVTPWPSEPPVQAWNCPMGGASLQSTTRVIPTRVLSDLDALLPKGFSLFKAQASEEGVFDDEQGIIDFDFSEPEFRFLSQVRVYHIEYSARVAGRDDDECRETNRSNVGSYDEYGYFSRQRIHPSAAPAWLNIRTGCSGLTGSFNNSRVYRRVGIEWYDHLGNWDSEMIDF